MKFWDRFRNWLIAPVFEGDEDKTRIASVLNILLWVLLGFVVLNGPITAIQTHNLPIITITLFISLLGMRYIAFQLGYIRTVGLVITTVTWGLFVLLGFAFLGASGTFLLGLILSVIIANVLLGRWWGLGFLALSVLVSLVVLYFDNHGMLLSPQPEEISRHASLLGAYFSLVVGSILLFLQSSGLQVALNKARIHTAQFKDQSIRLEQLIQERTTILERRARYLEVTADIARETAGMYGNPDQLLSLITRLIGRRLGFYHVGLFLIDSTRVWAVLRAVSSEGGQRMLARNHRLRIGEQGIVGFTAANQTHRIALDVGTDAIFFSNEDLPDTRSEIALPLLVRNELIGVLDVQSTEEAAFDDEGVSTLQVLANQVAVAINSSRLFEQQQAMVDLERRATGEISQNAWRELLQVERNLAYVSNESLTTHAGNMWPEEMRTALQTGEVTLSDTDDGETASIAVPIRVRGQVIGVIGGRKGSEAALWTEDEIVFLQALVEQLELSLEGARLYRDAQKFASREQTIGSVTSQIRGSLDMQTILQVTAQEIRTAMGLERIVVRLGVPSNGKTDKEV
jgi:GAF domain-containing protein